MAGHGALKPSRFLGAGAKVAAIRILGLGCVFALQVVLARLLGDAAGYGSYAWGQSLLFFFGGIAALGMPLAAARFIAVLVDRGDEDGARRVLRRARRHVLLAALVLLALALVLSLVDPGGHLGGLSTSLVVVALVGAPAAAWLNLNQSVARARGWLVAAFLPSQLLRPLVTGCLALLAAGLLTTPGPAVYLACVPLAILLVSLVQERFLRRGASAILPANGVPDLEYGGNRLLRTGAPILAIQLAGLLRQHGSTLLLGLFAGPAAAGAYFAARRLAELALLPEQIVSAVTQPMFASAHASQSHATFERTAWYATHLAFWTTLAGSLLLLGLGLGPLLLGLFGRDFEAAVPVLALLLLANCLGLSFGPFRDVLIMGGQQAALSKASIAVTALHLALLFALLPRYGALGAAAVQCMTAAMLGGAGAFIARRRLQARVTLLDACRVLSGTRA